MKKIKVNWMGKPMCEIYPHATSWDVFVYKTMRIIVKTAQVSAISLAVFAVATLAFYLGKSDKVSAVNYTAEIDKTDTLAVRIDELKTNLINEIAKLESNNAKDEDALIVYDDNRKGTLQRKDKVSIGCMQFKISTIQLYEKKLNQQDLTNYEAVMLALDCQKSKELAKKIVFEEDGGIFNWSVATKAMGNKVTFIKEL